MKGSLPFFGLDRQEGEEEREGVGIYDGGVAAYLLNPLKDSYGYDDLARDYLGLDLPSQKDLLGKEPVGKALEAGEEKAFLCGCYMACVMQRAAGILKEKLEETGMWQLYREIEMPLIYSLYRMEQAGVKVKKTALKEYGDKLKVKISELEKEIYEGCGETFMALRTAEQADREIEEAYRLREAKELERAELLKSKKKYKIR